MNIKTKTKLLFSAIKERKISTAFNTIFSYLTFRLEPNKVFTSPVYLQIEPTTRCNLKCKMCYGTYKRRSVPDMTFEQFKKIIDQTPHLITTHLQGLGESFLNKDLFRMIKYAKFKKIRVNLSTNATIFTKELNKKIIDSGLDNMEVSLDGAKPTTYNKIRVGADFNKVIENVKEFIKQKGESKKPTLKITSVVMKENYKEMLDLVKLAHNLNINSIYFLIAQGWNDKQGLVKSNTPKQEITKYIKKAKKYAKNLGVYFDTSISTKTNTSRECKRPWLSASITVDGYITPCCRVTNPNVCNFGNIFEEPFNKVWNKKTYKEFRKKLKTNKQPICNNCELYYRDPFKREDL